VAVVTGSGRGLGRAIAVKLAQRGLAVVVNAARNGAEADESAALARACGVPALAVLADVSRREGVERLFGAVAARFGRLDVLVCNAGVNRDGPVAAMTDQQWQEVLNTNLTGPFMCCQAALPLMERAGGGSIVNITARTAQRPRRNGANYCSAKAGLSMLTRCLALELAPRIRVNAVAPGSTDTQEIRERFQLETAAGLERMVQAIPLGRIAAPEEMAELVAFVALDAGFMTGAEVVADGGRNLQ
jgi:acetoacetyl-CoA reductase/3-oxoacyl-[acyl-carrier protein] reductase